jgi:Arc/MetJ-type ribon-helix-helix transcriptional regulator
MTVLKPRSRMISVRLSEDEYSALQQLCASTGARSVSDLTRDAMRALLNGQVRDSAPTNFVDEFRTRLSNLDQKVEELAGRVALSRSGLES